MWNRPPKALHLFPVDEFLQGANVHPDGGGVIPQAFGSMPVSQLAPVVAEDVRDLAVQERGQERAILSSGVPSRRTRPDSVAAGISSAARITSWATSEAPT